MQVPGLATKISQLTLQMNSTGVTKPYDTVTCLSLLTSDIISTVESIENYAEDQVFAFNLATNKKSKFQGVCAACGKVNHHEWECNFLMKMKHCLAYMKSDKSAGSRKAKYYESKGEYTPQQDKVHFLQKHNFIPPIIDLDLLLDISDTVEHKAQNTFDAQINENECYSQVASKINFLVASYKTYNHDMDDSIDACRYLPFCKNEGFIQVDADDVCNVILQQLKTSNFSTAK